MSIKPLDRLLFAQGQRCFFCRQALAAEDASVEHLLARANDGSSSDDNCVACCKALNSLFGSISIKAKMQIVLNQAGDFQCPKMQAAAQSACQPAAATSKVTADSLALVVEDLNKRGAARPRTLEKLVNAVSARFQVEPSTARAMVERLRAEAVIAVEGTNVAYLLLDQSA